MDTDLLCRRVTAADMRLYGILRQHVERVLAEIPRDDDLLASARGAIAECMFIPVPVPWLVAATGIAVVALQVRRPQFSGAESDEGARMVRHRSGVFDAAAPVAHHAHDEQSPDHGTQDVLGWATTGAIFLASFGLVANFFM